MQPIFFTIINQPSTTNKKRYKLLQVKEWLAKGIIEKKTGDNESVIKLCNILRFAVMSGKIRIVYNFRLLNLFA